MNNSSQHGQNEESEPIVPGFEAPPSPESSYDNVYNLNEDEKHPPPELPPHLEKPPPELPIHLEKPLTFQRITSGEVTLDQPPNSVALNHLYTIVDDRKFPWEPVGFATTECFGSKYTTVVVYQQPPQR
ncbi:unnamed protein product [Cuscuta epithymum]|uniref:Association with the SNF1 complex (ASC) domain-containing protein n=1 Tax=Cuscuta epithymum TaxID=186058 RepID=A0AAV0FRG8_9ASTE|nr:unnamed protein product [Cuscuta epithymum]